MSKHMKRLVAPRVMRIHRKEATWTTRSDPGPHSLKKSIPLGTIVRDYLELCDTYREAKNIIANGNILVDGKPRKSHHYPCGFMDVLSIPKLKKDYRMVYGCNGKLELVPISGKDAQWKLCRVENKTILRGGKIQLNFHDGKNKLVENNDYSTGDVLKLSFNDNRVEDVYKFEKGTVSLIIGGSHIGQIASIEDLKIVHSSRPNIATMKGIKEFFTITHYVFPIGKTKPTITIPEVRM